VGREREREREHIYIYIYLYIYIYPQLTITSFSHSWEPTRIVDGSVAAALALGHVPRPARRALALGPLAFGRAALALGRVYRYIYTHIHTYTDGASTKGAYIHTHTHTHTHTHAHTHTYIYTYRREVGIQLGYMQLAGRRAVIPKGEWASGDSLQPLINRYG